MHILNNGLLIILCCHLKENGKDANLCMESWAIPQSTVRMPTPEASIGPMVDPHPISFLTTNSYIDMDELGQHYFLEPIHPDI